MALSQLTMIENPSSCASRTSTGSRVMRRSSGATYRENIRAARSSRARSVNSGDGVWSMITLSDR
jgi:hypothetical protein